MDFNLGWNTVKGGLQSFGRGVGELFGMNFDPNLDTLQAFKTYQFGDTPLTFDQQLQLSKAYDNALARQSYQNSQALAPWSLGLQGLGAVANWWGQSRQADAMEKALKSQLKIQRANFNNSAQLLDERREDRARNRTQFAGTPYVAPTPLARV